MEYLKIPIPASITKAQAAEDVGTFLNYQEEIEEFVEHNYTDWTLEQVQAFVRDETISFYSVVSNPIVEAEAGMFTVTYTKKNMIPNPQSKYDFAIAEIIKPVGKIFRDSQLYKAMLTANADLKVSEDAVAEEKATLAATSAATLAGLEEMTKDLVGE